MKKINKVYLERNFRSSRRDLSFDNLVSAALPFFESVNSPVSLGSYLRLKYGSYESYLEMEVDPMDYQDRSDDFHLDYQCVKLFSKAEFFPRVFDTKKVAIESFIQSEMDCLQTNRRFEVSNCKDAKAYKPFSPAVSAVFHCAKRKITKILGDCPDIAELSISFGPGNNVGLSKTTSVYDKLTAELTYTGNLKPIIPRVMETCPSWSNYRAKGSVPTLPSQVEIPVKEVSGSALGFVPKNAKTMRTICTEPLLNSFVQLGIGKHMRRRLAKAGCNLNSQTRNQELARIGSLSNTLSTIDLKAASDTISYHVVLEMLPLPWFDLLDTVRSPQYTYEGKYYSFNKFSSMGNGYTFELESLIFLAISRAVCDVLNISCEQVSVYGDDIIVPTDAVLLLRECLLACGFVVNESKSFTQGPFRESCGKDWFLGVQVRPLFLKRRPTNATLMGWCNHIWRTSDGLIDHRWKALYDGLKSLVSQPYSTIEGPDGFGDGHFITSRELYRASGHHSRRRCGWEGVGYYTLSSSPIPKYADDDAVYVAALYAAQNCKTVRNFSKQHKLSHQSKDGYYYALARDRTRTVLRRAFHPWNTG